MDGYLKYQNLLSSALQEQAAAGTKARTTFQTAVEETEGKKAEIDRFTELGEAPLVAKFSEKIVGTAGKGLDSLTGGAVSKVKDLVNNKIKQTVTNAKNQLTKSTQPKVEADAEEPIEMQEMSSPTSVETAPTQEEALAEIRSRAQRITTQEDLPEGSGEIQPGATANNVSEATESQSQPISGTTNADASNGQAVGPDADAMADASADASSNAVANTGSSLTEGLSAGADAGLDTGGAALLDDPFTFIVGLAMLIGGAVGGAEASRSVKTPSPPKPPPIANVSTQFGF